MRVRGAVPLATAIASAAVAVVGAAAVNAQPMKPNSPSTYEAVQSDVGYGVWQPGSQPPFPQTSFEATSCASGGTLLTVTYGTKASGKYLQVSQQGVGKPCVPVPTGIGGSAGGYGLNSQNANWDAFGKCSGGATTCKQAPYGGFLAYGYSTMKVPPPSGSTLKPTLMQTYSSGVNQNAVQNFLMKFKAVGAQ